MQDSLQFDYLFKYILVGDTSVGKSTLLHQYINKQFKESSNPTMGVQFATKKIQINNKLIKIQIWDTVIFKIYMNNQIHFQAGQESFRTITRAYYKNAIGIILVYDLAQPKSFNTIKSWFQEIQNNSNQQAQIIVVGNKSDLLTHNLNANEYSGQYQFISTSAKTGKNIDNLFMNLTKNVLNKIQKGQIPVDGVIYLFYTILHQLQTSGIKKGNAQNKKLKLNNSQNKLFKSSFNGQGYQGDRKKCC